MRNRGLSPINTILAVMLMMSANSRAADTLAQAINPDLPVHKGTKLHPEFSDPVLGCVDNQRVLKCHLISIVN